MATDEAQETARDLPSDGDPEAASLIDRIGPARAQALMNEAVREAIARADAAGLPQAHIDEEGRVYRRYPDGRIEYPEWGE